MGIRLAWAFLINILLYTGLFAQIKIEGTVKNSTGTAVSFATVSILAPNNGVILYYSSSDKNGNYSIILPDNQTDIKTLTLQITCLGYQKETRLLQKDTSTYHFILKEESKDLEPVVIKGERIRLNLKGDTLSYNAASFANPNDRVIEDVIKRLPGIEVDEKGKIEYNGKAITNFYIDGDNLLDDKYAIGTKNIPNNIVDKVQVFLNHQPIKVLAEVSVTDQIDMNITLKEDAKIKLINHAELAAGLPENYNGALTSMLFRKYKALNYFKANNTGIDLNDEVTSFNLQDLLNRLDIQKPGNLLSLGTISQPPLPKYRYLFNNTGMINTNNLLNIKKDVQIKSNIYYLYDHQQQDYQSETTIFLPNDTIHYNERQSNNAYPNQLHAQLNLNINKTTYYLNNTFIADYNPQSANSLLNTNGSEVKQAVQNNLRNFSNELNYMFNRNQKALEFYSYINRVDEPQILKINPGLNADYFNDGNPYHGLNQTTSIPSFFTNTYFTLHYGSLKFKQSYKIGINTQHENLRSSLTKTLLDSKNPLPLDSGINNLQWNRNKLYVESSYIWTKDKFKLDFSLPLSYQHIGYSDDAYQQKVTRNHLLFNPKAKLEYRSGQENRILLDYQYNTNFGGIEDVHTGYILKNYRTVSTNSAPVFESNTHAAHLGFQYRKTIKVFFVNLNIAYSHKTVDNISTRIINNSIEQQISLPLINNANSLNVYGGISKYIFSLKTTVSSNISWAANRINQLLNEQLLPFNNYNTTITTNVNSKLSERLYLTYTANYNHFQSAQQGGNSIRTNQPRINQIQQKLVVDFQALSNLNLNVVGEQLYSQQSFSNTSNVYFIDLSLRYKLNKYQTDLEVGVQNIADVKQFTTTTVNANASVINQYAIRGRMAFLKISFNF